MFDYNKIKGNFQSPVAMTYEFTKKIVEQMGKNICKVFFNNKWKGTGFFCKIPFHNKDKMLSFFFTNHHVIGEDILKQEDKKLIFCIKEKMQTKEIKLKDRKYYTSKKYDTTIIEIKENDNIKDYLQLDDKIICDILYDEDLNEEYENKNIYIIQYPVGILSFSFGIIKKIKENEAFNLYHNLITKGGASGSPLLGLDNKVIGIHKASFMGTFINH